jgi:hypothetical protein
LFIFIASGKRLNSSIVTLERGSYSIEDRTIVFNETAFSNKNFEISNP